MPKSAAPALVALFWSMIARILWSTFKGYWEDLSLQNVIIIAHRDITMVKDSFINLDQDLFKIVKIFG